MFPPSFEHVQKMQPSEAANPYPPPLPLTPVLRGRPRAAQRLGVGQLPRTPQRPLLARALCGRRRPGIGCLWLSRTRSFFPGAETRRQALRGSVGAFPSGCGLQVGTSRIPRPSASSPSLERSSRWDQISV